MLPRGNKCRTWQIPLNDRRMTCIPSSTSCCTSLFTSTKPRWPTGVSHQSSRRPDPISQLTLNQVLNALVLLSFFQASSSEVTHVFFMRFAKSMCDRSQFHYFLTFAFPWVHTIIMCCEFSSGVYMKRKTQIKQCPHIPSSGILAHNSSLVKNEVLLPRQSIHSDEKASVLS